MSKRSWADDDLRVAVAANNTISGTLRALGISTSPGNYRSFHKHTHRLGLDTSHFVGRAHGRSSRKLEIPLKEILVRESYYGTSRLRKRLIKGDLLEEKCARCGLGSVWQCEPITLQLDHINSDPHDHRIGNLRLLCPNCHSQTSSFKSSKGRYCSPPPKCADCGAPIARNVTRCLSCEQRNRSRTQLKIEWPSVDGLAKRVVVSSYTQVARELGVTDNAIRKYFRRKLGFIPRSQAPQGQPRKGSAN